MSILGLSFVGRFVLLECPPSEVSLYNAGISTVHAHASVVGNVIILQKLALVVQYYCFKKFEIRFPFLDSYK